MPCDLRKIAPNSWNGTSEQTARFEKKQWPFPSPPPAPRLLPRGVRSSHIPPGRCLGAQRASLELLTPTLKGSPADGQRKANLLQLGQLGCQFRIGALLRDVIQFDVADHALFVNDDGGAVGDAFVG